jgi:hypothetical protein
MAACVTVGPEPTQAMTRAHTLVNQADKADVQRDAPDDVHRAHEELEHAERATGEQKYDEARRYAEAAAVDADLAIARAGAVEQERAAKEVARSNAALRQEAAPGAESSDPDPN